MSLKERFEAIYRQGDVPWDTGRPQTEVLSLVKAKRIIAPVLEIGCGYGHNVQYLAKEGIKSTGLDLSTTAISAAKARDCDTNHQGRRSHFHVADFHSWAPPHCEYATIIDIGTLHVQPRINLTQYIQKMHDILIPGGMTFVMCFSDSAPATYQHRFSKADLCSLFGFGWIIQQCKACRFDLRSKNTPGPKAWLLSAMRETSSAQKPGILLK